MATKIRLKRIGRRNRPFFRVVVIDSRKRRDGAPIEEVGWYDPIKNKENFSLKEDRIIHWLELGAQPTFTVKNLMKKAGLSYKWHMIRQGLDEQAIDLELQKWLLDREEREKQKEAEKLKLAVELVKTQAISEADLSETVEAEKQVEAKTETTELDSDEKLKEPVVDSEKTSEENDRESESIESESAEKPKKEVEPEVVEDAEPSKEVSEAVEKKELDKSEDEQGKKSEVSEGEQETESDEEAKANEEDVTEVESTDESKNTAPGKNKGDSKVVKKRKKEENKQSGLNTGEKGQFRDENENVDGDSADDENEEESSNK
ncbi:MAG: 30S ribosomal protein S16 [Candidatus Marinimicrobia bacterium]|nr:30S ribosomal protein S16 [Candidatus Neomarinimicrobiota bacterium]